MSFRARKINGLLVTNVCLENEGGFQPRALACAAHRRLSWMPEYSTHRDQLRTLRPAVELKAQQAVTRCAAHWDAELVALGHLDYQDTSSQIVAVILHAPMTTRVPRRVPGILVTTNFGVHL
jgi:hypothetical protein